MADEALDDMLLEATGGPKGTHGPEKAGSSRTPAKRRSPIQGDSSDDQSDYKLQNDFDDDYEDDYDKGRKADGSKMPLKKRLVPTDKDGEEEDQDGYESELSFGSDLYKDDEDRSRLSVMTELHRAMILHDRAEARDNFLSKAKYGWKSKSKKNIIAKGVKGLPGVMENLKKFSLR